MKIPASKERQKRAKEKETRATKWAHNFVKIETALNYTHFDHLNFQVNKFSINFK